MNKHPEDLHQLILDTAERILREDGYPGLTMRRIAKDSGIALGSIYNYFPCKTELVRAMMLTFWDHFFEELEKPAPPASTFETEMEAIYQLLHTFSKNFRSIWRTLNEGSGVGKPGLRAGQPEYLDKLVSIIQSKLEHARAIDPNADRPDANDAMTSQEWARLIVTTIIARSQFPLVDMTVFRKLTRLAIQ